MDKEQLFRQFEKNVEYLKRNVPPDDIYMFTEQTFMAAMYFIKKWSEWVDVGEEASKDPVTKKWVSNIVGFHMFRERGEDVQLDLDMEMIE